MSEDAASLHLKVDTSEVTKGQKALDDLAKTGEKTEKSIKDLGAESTRSKRSIDQLGLSAKMAGDGAKSASAGFSSFRSVIATLGMVSLAREAIAMADSYTKMTAQLKIATSSTEEYKKAMQSVKQISSVAQVDIMAITALYSRLSTSLKEVGTSQKSIAAITETVALALKVGGASSGEAASAMLQLSQAFASGVLRGEEFNAVSESAPNLLRALAASMQIPFGELRKLASQGQITSDVLTRAFSDPALLSQMRKQAKDVTTISGAFTNLQNSILLFVGANDKAVGSSSMMAKFLNGIADKIEQITIKTQGLWLIAQKFIGMDGEKPGSQESSGKIRGVEPPKFTPDVNLRFMQKQYDDLFKSFSEGEISAKKFAEEVKKAYVEAGYLAGVDKDAAKAAKQHAADVAQLMESIKRRIAEERLQLALGRDLTNGEKALSDVKADMASKAVTLGDKEFKLYETFTKELDAVEKLNAANEKLKKVREDIAGIVLSAETASDDQISRLELENSLVGKSVLQQQLLRAEYESNLALKRQFAEIDKATKGVTDPAAVAKLQAESNARIEAIKAEARAKINARYLDDVAMTVKAHKNPDLIAASGATQIQAAAAARLVAAEAEHAQAVQKIADYDAIFAREKAQREFDRDSRLEDLRYANEKEKLAADIADAESQRLAALQDYRDGQIDGRLNDSPEDEIKYQQLISQGFMERIEFLEQVKKKNDELHNSIAANLTGELLKEQEKNKVSIEGIEKYKEANQQLSDKQQEIAAYAQDADEAKRLGIQFQLKLQKDHLAYLATRSAYEIDGIGTGKERLAIEAEMVRLNKELAGLDVGAAAKAKLKADADKTALEAAQTLADTAKKTMNADFVKQFESDFHGGMLRLLEFGNTSWDAMMKGWKNSAKVNVFDYLYKQLAKPFVFKFIASMAGLVGANGVAADALTKADAGLLTGDKVSTTSWLSIGKSLWDGMSGGFDAFGNLVAEGYSRIGGYLADHGLSEVGKSMMQTAADGGVASVGSYLGAGIAGVTIGTFIAGDKTLLGLNGMTSSSIGAALGAVFGGPIGAFLGGIAGGALNAFFGMGPKQYGESTVKGGFTGAGFEGGIATPWTQKGGLFRSNKSGEDMSALTDTGQQFLNSMVGKSGIAFARLVTISGDAARSVDGWSFAINRALKTEEDFTKLFGEMADSMGTFVIPELEKFRTKGENLADTAIRLGDEYIITQTIFEMLGHSAYETGIASLGMRDSLIQLMGGISATSSAMDAYYKNFYTADEQQANSLKQVNAALRLIGDAVPTTRAEFRKLVEGLDLTTEAGQRQFSSYMALVPAFANVTQPIEDLTQNLIDMAAASKTAMDAIGSALDQLRGNNAGSIFQAQLAQDTAMTALTAAAPWITSFDQLSTITMEDASNYSLANKQLIASALGAGATLKGLKDNIAAAADKIKADAIGKAKQAVTDSFATLQRAVTSERDSITKNFTSAVAAVNLTITKLTSLSSVLRQSVSTINAPTRAQAQAQIMAVLAIAKAGGGLPAAESLNDALQAIAQPSEKLFSTFVEWQTDQKLTGNNIAALADMSDGQLSTAEKTLATLNSTQEFQISRLDGILASGQSQLDIMNGVNTSVLTVASAVYAMTDSINAYMKLVPGAGMSAVGLPSASIPTTDGLSGMQFGMGMTIQDGKLTFSDSASASAISQITASGMQSEIARRQGLRSSTGSAYVDPVQAQPSAGVSYATPVSAGALSRSAAFNAAWSLLNGVPINNKVEPTEYEKYLRLITANKPTQYHIPPGFASGGLHTGGARIVGENGPELEFTGPSRIVSNSNSKKLLNTEKLEALVVEIKEAIVHLNIDTNINAIKTKKTADILEKWETTGVAPERATL